MQGDQLARSTQRLIRMLRPESVGTAAQTAMTWFKPQLLPPAITIRSEAFRTIRPRWDGSAPSRSGWRSKSAT